MVSKYVVKKPFLGIKKDSSLEIDPKRENPNVYIHLVSDVQVFGDGKEMSTEHLVELSADLVKEYESKGYIVPAEDAEKVNEFIDQIKEEQIKEGDALKQQEDEHSGTSKKVQDEFEKLGETIQSLEKELADLKSKREELNKASNPNVVYINPWVNYADWRYLNNWNNTRWQFPYFFF